MRNRSVWQGKLHICAIVCNDRIGKLHVEVDANVSAKTEGIANKICADAILEYSAVLALAVLIGMATECVPLCIAVKDICNRRSVIAAPIIVVLIYLFAIQNRCRFLADVLPPNRAVLAF